MFPFDSTGDVAAQTRARLAAPQTNTPGQRLSKWATTPIGLQNNVKTPTQVMQPAIKTEAPKPAAPAGPDFSAMIKRGGGNPDAFHTEGSQLVSSRSPQEIQSDIAAHPPITTAAGQSLLKPAAPVASVPTVGVQGAPAAAAAPATARPVVSLDPYRAAENQLRNRQADAASAANSPINDYPRIAADRAARNDLFRQFHGGMNPGEYQDSQGSGVPMHMGGNPTSYGNRRWGQTGDEARERLLDQQRMTHETLAHDGVRDNVIIDPNGIPHHIPNTLPGKAADASGAVAQYDHAKAQARAVDPATQIGLLKGIARDRDARNIYLSGKGVSPAEINAMPQPGLQVDPSTGQDVNQYIRSNAGNPLGDVLAGLPFEQSPQVQAALQAHINKQYADPKAWEQAYRRPQPASEYGYSGPLPGLFSGPAKLWQAGSDRLFGGGQNDQDDPVLSSLMRRYGLKPPSHGLTSADSGVGNPY